MKVRIGYGLGTQGLVNDGGEFGAIVDALEDLGFDSVWVSERATSPTLDPLVALAFVAGRTRRVKLGTSVQVLPGRNPVLLAKAWASLDRVSGGRALPAFGLGVADPAEQQAFGVARGERAALFDEAHAGLEDYALDAHESQCTALSSWRLCAWRCCRDCRPEEDGRGTPCPRN